MQSWGSGLENPTCLKLKAISPPAKVHSPYPHFQNPQSVENKIFSPIHLAATLSDLSEQWQT